MTARTITPEEAARWAIDKAAGFKRDHSSEWWALMKGESVTIGDETEQDVEADLEDLEDEDFDDDEPGDEDDEGDEDAAASNVSGLMKLAEKYRAADPQERAGMWEALPEETRQWLNKHAEVSGPIAVALEEDFAPTFDAKEADRARSDIKKLLPKASRGELDLDSATRWALRDLVNQSEFGGPASDTAAVRAREILTRAEDESSRRLMPDWSEGRVIRRTQRYDSLVAGWVEEQEDDLGRTRVVKLDKETTPHAVAPQKKTGWTKEEARAMSVADIRRLSPKEMDAFFREHRDVIDEHLRKSSDALEDQARQQTMIRGGA